MNAGDEIKHCFATLASLERPAAACRGKGALHQEEEEDSPGCGF